MSRRSAVLAAVLALPALFARPVAAQVEVTPFVGMALTTRNMVFDTAGGAYVRMSSHAIYGLRIGAPVSERLHLDVALFGGAGALEHYASEALEFDFTMLAADLRGRYRVAGGESAALALVSCSGGDPPAPPEAAHEVSQPAGWDDELKMPVPDDLNPDPHVLEVELEARVADIEILPGTTTPVWTYNGTLPGPMLRASVGDRVIVMVGCAVMLAAGAIHLR